MGVCLTFHACSDVIRKWNDSPETVLPILSNLSKAGLRIWVYRYSHFKLYWNASHTTFLSYALIMVQSTLSKFELSFTFDLWVSLKLGSLHHPTPTWSCSTKMRFLLNLFGYEFGLVSGLDFYFLILLCLVLQWRHWWESAYNINKIQYKQDGVKGEEGMEGMVSQAPSCWVDCWIWRLDLSYGERGRSPGPGLCARSVSFSLLPFPLWYFFTIFSLLAISFGFYLPPFLSHPSLLCGGGCLFSCSCIWGSKRL